MRRSIEYIDSNILSGLEAEGKIMKRDKKFVIFIVFISIAITVVLQYSHSPEVRRMVPYLTALERSLSAHGEGNANEFHSVNNPFKPVTGDDVIPVEYFIEEQRIIEEFTNEKQFKPILCRTGPKDYISLSNGMKLVVDSYIFDKIPQLQKRDEKTGKIIVSKEFRRADMYSIFETSHVIRANDNLYNLAKKYYNDESKWKIIYEANKSKMPNQHSLQIGQELRIPDITVSNNENRSITHKTLL